MTEESAKTWVEAEWADSLDEELEMEIDDFLVAKDLAFISAKKHKSTIDRNTYFHELLRLQAELVKLQDWVQHTGEKIVIIFEGRDAAIFIGDDTEPLPMRPRTLVANATSCRRPGRALPTIVSDSPEEYTSAVSIKLMPPSSARPTIASADVSSSPPIACQIWPLPPNVMAPRQSSETNTPVSESARYFMMTGVLRGAPE